MVMVVPVEPLAGPLRTVTVMSGLDTTMVLPARALLVSLVSETELP
jgi:hypothetical protein